jgi:GNAT superfamily N-acetyltransferase
MEEGYAMHVEYRLLTLDDVPAADQITMAAYQAPSRAVEIARDLALQPDGWWLAWTDGVPVGFGGVVDYGPFAYIGLISTLPTMQRQGIGRGLMDHILAWLEGRGCPMALLDASPAGKPLYDQLGFVTDDRSVVWQGSAPEDLAATVAHLHDKDADTATRVLLMTQDNLTALCAYDTPRFGADRWAVFADLLVAYPERAWLAQDATGAITGFAIAQPRTIGPWLADDPATACSLLAHALALPFTQPPTVLAPASNTAAASLLESAGFAPLRALSHMRRGGTDSRSRLTHFGLASFALG